MCQMHPSILPQTTFSKEKLDGSPKSRQGLWIPLEEVVRSEVDGFCEIYDLEEWRIGRGRR